MITYNQQHYIEKCLKGIVEQNVDFKIEVVVFDDFSTDKTWEIIQSFAVEFDYIKCYRHDKNVGMMANLNAALLKCSGEFIALCEGDDFWIDSNKIRDQVNYSKENTNFGMLIHPAYEADADSNVSEVLFNRGSEIKFFYLNDILSQTGQFAPTASYFFPRTVLEKLPKWFETATLGDLFLEIYSTKVGPVVYMPHASACYRTHSVNSWSFHARKFNYRKNLSRSKSLEYDLRKCSEDFSNTALFNRKISETLSAQAESYLMLKETSHFKESIIESARLHRALNRSQNIMIFFRYTPWLLKPIMRFKHWFISR